MGRAWSRSNHDITRDSVEQVDVAAFSTYVVFGYRFGQRLAFSHNREFDEVRWFESTDLTERPGIFVKGQVRALSRLLKER